MTEFVPWTKDELIEQLQEDGRVYVSRMNATVKENKRLVRALYFATGLISTYPPHDTKHPFDVYDWILKEANKDE